jgi:DNA modification methylase
MSLDQYLNKITCGDCYELIKNLPDKSIDLIVTDPPYQLETEGSKENSISKTFANCNSELKEIDEGIRLEILDEYMRVMKRPNIYIWCNKKQIPDYLDFFVKKHGCSFEIMTWLKTNPTPLCGGNYLIDKEFCLYFRKGVRLNTRFETAFTYWQSPKNKSDKDSFAHPTCKPTFILKMLIENSSNEGDVVLDTFGGSGSTCISAKELNRNFVAFEINPKWCKIANDRLENIDANGQMSLFAR